MKPKTAYLVDRKGAVHGTHIFYDKDTRRSIDCINPAVMVASGMKYTLASPEADDYLLHIERLFETGE